MKESKKCISLFFVLLVLAIPAWTMELEIQGGLGNNAFDKSKVLEPDPSIPDPDPFVFEPNLFPLYRAAVSGEMGTNFHYNGGFEHDQILGNMLFANMGIKLDYFVLEVGSFFGIFNSGKDLLNPGISIYVGLEFPEIFFVSLHASSSLGSNTNIPGVYSQNSSGFQAGIWVPNVRFSLNIENKNFTMGHEHFALTEDNQTRYFLKSEVFAKNMPYTVVVDIGYQSLGHNSYIQRINIDNFNPGATPPVPPELVRESYSYELRSLFLGFQGTLSVAPGFKVLLGAEMPIFTWSGSDNMVGPGSKTALFSAHAGILWTLPSSAPSE